MYSPRDAGHVYASSQFGDIERFRNGRRANVTPTNVAYASESGRVWMVYIAMDPRDEETVFTGTLRLWKTKDDGGRWEDVSPSLDGSPITAIDVSRADRRRLYVGTENGGFFRSRDGGKHWSPDLQGATLPGTTVTRIASSPEDADIVFASVANFGHAHVYRSDDGGDTWRDVDRGQLHDVPHHAIVIPSGEPRTLYVSSDAGVFRSPDLGETWTDLTRNLPNVMVVDLVHHRDRPRADGGHLRPQLVAARRGELSGQPWPLRFLNQSARPRRLSGPSGTFAPDGFRGAASGGRSAPAAGFRGRRRRGRALLAVGTFPRSYAAAGPVTGDAPSTSRPLAGRTRAGAGGPRRTTRASSRRCPARRAAPPRRPASRARPCGPSAERRTRTRGAKV